MYFADPNSPWKSGTNEHTNGLLRKYCSKGANFNQLTINQIKVAQVKLNNRLRKVLNRKTPKQEFKIPLRALET